MKSVLLIDGIFCFRCCSDVPLFEDIRIVPVHVAGKTQSVVCAWHVRTSIAGGYSLGGLSAFRIDMMLEQERGLRKREKKNQGHDAPHLE